MSKKSLLIGLLAAVITPLAARAQSYTVTILVDSNETRPDQNTPWYVFGAPVLDGDTAVFMTKNSQTFYTLDGIWAIDTATLATTKLAGLSTPVPGGNGSFSGFALFPDTANPLPTVGNGTVVFYGTDQSGTQGMYTIAEGGGTISKLVTTATLAPDDGTPFTFFSNARTNGTKVVFDAKTQGGRGGIFEINVHGTGLRTVIDNTVQLNARGYGGGTDYYDGYSAPVIGAMQVDFYATGVGDPSTYPNEIFATAGSGFAGRADNLTALGGDPAGVGHTQITGYSIGIEGKQMAMAAFDGSYAGLFTVPNTITATAAALVSTRSKVPDGSGTYTSFQGFSEDSSGFGFTATDATFGQSVWFKPPGGKPVLIAAGTTYDQPNLADRSVSGGNLVFFDGSIYGNGIYVARPAAAPAR